MRRDQRPVQVEPDAEPGRTVKPYVLRCKSCSNDAMPGRDICVSCAQAHPVSLRQARDNAQLATMKLERESLARRLETMAPDDHARITYPDVIKRYDEQIARFEQMIEGGM